MASPGLVQWVDRKWEEIIEYRAQLPSMDYLGHEEDEAEDMKLLEAVREITVFYLDGACRQQKKTSKGD